MIFARKCLGEKSCGTVTTMERKTDMEEEKQTLNGLITDEQIAEIKRSVTNTNSMMFSYVELVRRTLDFIEQNKEKQCEK